MLTEVQTALPTTETDAAHTQPATTAQLPAAGKTGEAVGEKPRILDDVVIEEVSIDGMCGVY